MGVERETITKLAVALDLLVVLVYIGYLKYSDTVIKSEAEGFDRKTLTITDFALQFYNLPAKEKYGDPLLLKAYLTDYLKKVVQNANNGEKLMMWKDHDQPFEFD